VSIVRGGIIVKINTISFYGGPRDGWKCRIEGALPPKIVFDEVIVDVRGQKKVQIPEETYYPGSPGGLVYYHEANINVCNIKSSGKRTTTPR
jgi:hypothetical protein